MVLINVPVDFREQKFLVSTTRHRPSFAVEEIRGRINLSLSQTSDSGRQGRSANRAQVRRTGEHGNTGEVTLLLIVAEKEKCFVLNDWAADGAAELISSVRRLVGYWGGHAADDLA